MTPGRSMKPKTAHSIDGAGHADAITNGTGARPYAPNGISCYFFGPVNEIWHKGAMQAKLVAW